ncbi:hypothetical protein N0V88_003701 [Collariella sp. IMI 366227]|nr:hypothetical protein N0V88_003701 [Collariella sp. IMI 366227]
MADPARYRYADTTGRRSPPLYNPARSSMPLTGGGYTSLYSGDVNTMSASHHEGLSRHPDEYRTSAVPVSSNTYAVRKEPLSRSTSVNDGTRVHRIVDSKRPVIVTTKHHAPGPRAGSPSRDPYRSSDEGQYYTQPASSVPRGRTAAIDDEEYQRLKDRTHHDRLHRGSESYRPPRQGPLYASSNHRSNFDDEGYEYTKPSDLARYDLDHDQPRKTRRESVDRYCRPTVSISTDLTRPYEQNDRRARGPPPTTWGLDKINRTVAGGIYDGAGSRMPPLPPAAPLAPDGRRSGALEAPGSPREDLRGGPRPLSMIHDNDNYYYDGRDIRESDYEYFQDDSIPARGFGVRVASDDFEERQRPAEKVYHDRGHHRRYHDPEPRRRSDDDLDVVRQEYDPRDRRRHPDGDHHRVSAPERHRDREDYDDARYENYGRARKERRPSDDEPDSRKHPVREIVSKALGLAVTSAGLAAATKGKDNEDRDPSPRKRHPDDEPDRRRLDEADRRSRPSRKEPLLDDEDFEIVEHPRDREKPRKASETETRVSKKDADAAASSSRDDSSAAEDGKTSTRRRLRASSFNPNDTASLAEMKARLADIEAKTTARDAERTAEGKDRQSRRESSPTKEPSSDDRRPSDHDSDPENTSTAIVRKGNSDDSDLERQVRVVPPPKDGAVAGALAEKKPIKGILKQPRAQFPEEPNPVREGVAPHKDDKTKANVPQGARWTKISRKMVNPEALKIGKERFEVRDDFVIVLRVLSKEEIQAYAAATATLRERRKKEYEREAKIQAPEYEDDRERERERDGGRDDEDEKKRRHRHHRKEREDDERERRERERPRRHRHESDEEVQDVGEKYIRDVSRSHHRSHRD